MEVFTCTGRVGDGGEAVSVTDMFLNPRQSSQRRANIILSAEQPL